MSHSEDVRKLLLEKLEAMEKAGDQDFQEVESLNPPAGVFDPVEQESDHIDGQMKALELANAKHDLQLREHELKLKKQSLELRKELADWLKVRMVWWISAVLVTIWLSAVQIELPAGYPSCMPWISSFKVSDQVLITLLGATTLNLIGLLLVIFNHLFPGNGR